MNHDFQYDNVDNFSYTMAGGKRVCMQHGQLTIGDVMYEEHNEDDVYPLCRWIASMLLAAQVAALG